MRIADKTECIVATDLALELSWDNGVLLGCTLHWSSGRVPSGMTAAGARLREALARYEAGQPVEFPRVPMAFAELPPFTRTVLETLRREVPYGHTVSYGRLAEMAGSPGAARAVGGIMAANSWPLLVPCHRVLAANGALTGYSAEGGIRLKEHLLRLEGALP